MGPEDSPHQGGEFHVEVGEYPFEPPKITFQINVYHSNIGSNVGDINLDLLSDRWVPGRTLLISIKSLLLDPNPDEPLEPEIAKLYKDTYDLVKFNEIAKQWAQQYAVNQ